MKNSEIKVSLGIFLCFIAFEFFFKIIIKAIFGSYLATVGTMQTILCIIFNALILVLSLKLSTLLVYKNNKNVLDKSKIIKYIVLINFVITVILAFYYVFTFKEDYEYYEKEQADIENVNYSKKTKKEIELMKQINDAREALINNLNEQTNQDVIVSIVYIISRFLAMFLLALFLKQDSENNVSYNDLTEDQILAMGNRNLKIDNSTVVNNMEDTSPKNVFGAEHNSITNTISQEDAEERARRYEFLFEERKRKASIKGIDIALIILGSLSMVFSIGSPIIAIILSGIGLLTGRLNVGEKSHILATIGYMFCKISIVLAPSIMIISFVLSLFGVITALSAVTGIFTLFMH